MRFMFTSAVEFEGTEISANTWPRRMQLGEFRDNVAHSNFDGLMLDRGPNPEGRFKSEFEGVKRTFLPLHSVLRIDEVEKQGVSKITNVEGSNVAQFPMMYSPQGSDRSGPADS